MYSDNALLFVLHSSYNQRKRSIKTDMAPRRSDKNELPTLQTLLSC